MPVPNLLRWSMLRPVGGVLAALFIAGCVGPEVPRPSQVVAPSRASMRAYNPFVASDSGGHVYVSFYGQSPGEGYGLYFTRSLDGGATWLEKPVNLETAQPQKRRIGFHKLETDGKGNVYVTWPIEHEKRAHVWRTSEVKRRQSHDHGATWSEAPIIWAPKTLINYPSPWTGKDGELHVVWTEVVDGKGALLFNRTTQSGTAWLPSPIQIDHRRQDPPLEQPHSSFQPLPPAWPAIAHDAAGRIFVAWEERRGSSTGLYFNRSLDQGMTWVTADARVDRSTTEASVSRRPVIGTDGQGAVYMAWEDSRHGRFDIYLNRSLDLGGTWLAEDLQLNRDRPKTGSAIDPQVSADRQGRISVLWKEVSETSTSLRLTGSLDRGTSWFLRPRELVSQPDRTFLEAPRLGRSEEGHVYVTWAEYGPTKRAISFNRSTDQGESWLSHPLRLNDNGATYGVRLPRMSVDRGGTIYVVWSSTRSGGLDLFLNRSKDHGETWLPHELQVTR